MPFGRGKTAAGLILFDLLLEAADLVDGGGCMTPAMRVELGAALRERAYLANAMAVEAKMTVGLWGPQVVDILKRLDEGGRC